MKNKKNDEKIKLIDKTHKNFKDVYQIIFNQVLFITYIILRQEL